MIISDHNILCRECGNLAKFHYMYRRNEVPYYIESAYYCEECTSELFDKDIQRKAVQDAARYQHLFWRSK